MKKATDNKRVGTQLRVPFSFYRTVVVMDTKSKLPRLHKINLFPFCPYLKQTLSLSKF